MAQSAKKSRRCNERTEDVRRRRYLWRVWISHNMHTGHLLTIRHSVPLCFSVIFHWFIIHPLRPSLPFVSSSSSSSGRRSFRFCSGRGRGSGWRGCVSQIHFCFLKKKNQLSFLLSLSESSAKFPRIFPKKNYLNYANLTWNSIQVSAHSGGGRANRLRLHIDRFKVEASFQFDWKKNVIRVASKDLIRPMNEKVEDPSAADWKCRRIR